MYVPSNSQFETDFELAALNPKSAAVQAHLRRTALPPICITRIAGTLSRGLADLFKNHDLLG
jgi:hypothetical protein